MKKSLMVLPLLFAFSGFAEGVVMENRGALTEAALPTMGLDSGKGATKNEAYQDARKNIPSGASENSVVYEEMGDGSWKCLITWTSNWWVRRYLQRTEWNARDSDGTVVFTFAEKVTGGSLRTVEFAAKHGKPCIHISRNGTPDPEEALRTSVEDHRVGALNVAGSRESKEPGLHDWVMQVIESAFF
jgi:hypothetical protein